MKKGLIALLVFLFVAGAALAQEKEEQKKNDPVGVSVGIDYYSLYLWRGIKCFSGDGAFVPKASWTVFNSGLTLSVMGEVSSSWVFNGWWKKPGKYDYRVDGAGNIVRKNLNFNHAAYAAQTFDFGADYSYTIKDAVTIGASIWYWWFYNSGHAREFALPRVDGLNLVSNVDVSYMTTSVSIGLPIVPYVNPLIIVTHDYYTLLKKGGDFYVQLGLNHPFELTKEVSLTPGIMIGYYYNRSGEITRYNLMWDAGSGALDTTPSLSYSGQTRTITMAGVKQIHIPKRKGFSDITPSIALSYTKGIISLRGGFYWCIVPSKTWYNGAEIHRIYANVGISCSI